MRTSFLATLIALVCFQTMAQENTNMQEIEISGVIVRDRGNIYLYDVISPEVTASTKIMIPSFSAPGKTRPENLNRIPLYFIAGDEYVFLVDKSKLIKNPRGVSQISEVSIISVRKAEQTGAKNEERINELQKAYMDPSDAIPADLLAIKNEFFKATEQDLPAILEKIKRYHERNKNDFLLEMLTVFGRPEGFRKNHDIHEAIYIIRSDHLKVIEEFENITKITQKALFLKIDDDINYVNDILIQDYKTTIVHRNPYDLPLFFFEKDKSESAPEKETEK